MADILIVGGGVAGLSAGIFSLLRGHRAVVCEKHSAAGGNLTGWQRGEYHVDNCVHWLTGTNPATAGYRTWRELGAIGEDDVLYPNVLYTCTHGGASLSLCRDADRLRRDMLAVSAADEAEIRAFLKAVEAVRGVVGTAGKNADEKSGFFSVAARLPLLLRYHGMSTKRLSERFTHPLLQKFFGSLLGDDFSALALVVVFATFCGDNGGLPKGGSAAMAERIARRFTDLGGELLLNKEAAEIRTENGVATSVRFTDGEVRTAEYVVIAADPSAIFGKVLAAPLPRGLAARYKSRRYARFSSVHAAFACEAETLPFQGDVILRPSEAAACAIGSSNLIVREFSHEKGFAPAGKNIVQAFAFCSEAAARAYINLSRYPLAYARRKEELSREMRSAIEAEFPALRGKLRVLDVWTPSTYRRYTNAETGSYMSFILPPFGLPLRAGHAVRGLKNVFLATQWQTAPGGLPTAAAMGKRVVSAVEKAEKRARARARYRLRPAPFK